MKNKVKPKSIWVELAEGYWDVYGEPTGDEILEFVKIDPSLALNSIKTGDDRAYEDLCRAVFLKKAYVLKNDIDGIRYTTNRDISDLGKRMKHAEQMLDHKADRADWLIFHHVTSFAFWLFLIVMVLRSVFT